MGPRSTGGNPGLWTRRRFMQGAGVALAGVLLPWPAAHARLILCPRCGREAQPGQTECLHCEARLPQPAEPEPAAQPGDDEPEDLPQISPASRWERARSLEFLEADQPALALLFGRNALAVLVALDAQHLEAREDLLRLIHRCLAELSAARTPCPLCHGEGRRITLISGLDRVPRETTLPDSPCPLCRGRRELNVTTTAADLQRAMARAELQHREVRLAEGHQRAGEAWLAGSLLAELSIAARAAMQSTAARYCPECYGVGEPGCRHCEGAGRRPCRASGCVMGVQRCSVCNGSGREASTQRGTAPLRVCSACAGRGIASCTACEGNGWTECDPCNGRGSEPCRPCRGSGLRESCRRCDSQGTQPCRRCRGTGMQRGQPCTDCAQEGLMLCSLCGGDGHRRR